MREFSEQEIVRRNKVDEIRRVCNPYPEKYDVNYSLYDASMLADETKGVRVAGRIVFMRKMGKLSFLKLRDIKGDLQVSIKIDLVGEDSYQFFKDNIDIGDFLGVEGEMFTTHTGEKTLRADSYTFLGKALKPLPEKFHGLTDPELCYRHRYVDLIMNDDTRKRFLLKFEFIKEIRRFLEDDGYIEIETPVLSNKASGASAKPFTAHHNALDIDVYLRIAPEMYLKRAVVGGFNKVFEFARCFRNEGIDASHLQDFTMLECYCVYYNYKDNMVLLEKMLKHVISKVFGSLEMQINDNNIDFSTTWPIVSFRDLINKYAGIDIKEYNTKEKLLTEIKNKGITFETEDNIENLGYGNLIDALYKKVARPNLIQPTFLVGHPVELSPLARANDEDKTLTDRFQLVVNGAELINAYSELVDPIEQEKRLQEQARLKLLGDTEAMPMDYDYINAMEYGMPPISGWGMGIDRVLQILTGVENIKDNILFPLMRPMDK